MARVCLWNMGRVINSHLPAMAALDYGFFCGMTLLGGCSKHSCLMFPFKDIIWIRNYFTKNTWQYCIILEKVSRFAGCDMITLTIFFELFSTDGFIAKIILKYVSLARTGHF